MQKESLRNYYINPQRHNVFVSFHHADEYYRNIFEKLFTNGRNNIFIPQSVQLGDIDTDLKTETIRRKIREEHLHDTTVTVVLIGIHTWQRKYVDWEIAYAIQNTENHARSGLLGVFLPDYPLTINRFEPHLTEYQAAFRKWYDESLKKQENENLSPQKIQRKYENYDNLVCSMKDVNQLLIEYAEKLKIIAYGKSD